MSAQYKGQSPNRLWYAWQRTKAYVHCLKDKRTEKDAKKMARNGGLAAGSLVAAGLAGNYLFFIPLVPTLVPLAGAVVGGYFGWKAWQKVKLLKNSETVHGYIRKQENKWVQKKSAPSLLSRASALGKRLFGRAALPFATTGKWLGYGSALLGGAGATLAVLQATGMAQVPFWTSVTAGLAKAGALLGLSATATMTGSVILAAAAVPVGLGAGRLCKNMAKALKKDFIAHQAKNNPRPVLKSRLEKPAANNNPAPASTPEAAKSFSAAGAPRQGEELSEERKKAAAARAEARARKKGQPRPWL